MVIFPLKMVIFHSYVKLPEGIKIYPLVNVYIAMERSTSLQLGKSTISTRAFSIAMLHITGGLYLPNIWGWFMVYDW
jgi:hypothetical protein